MLFHLSSSFLPSGSTSSTLSLASSAKALAVLSNPLFCRYSIMSLLSCIICAWDRTMS